MIFPTINFPRATLVGDQLVYADKRLANIVDSRVRISDAQPFLAKEIWLEDGALLICTLNDSDYGETDFKLTYNMTVTRFSNCSLVSFGQGWLVLKRLVCESHSGYLAYNYLSSRLLEFTKDQASTLYCESGLFFARTRREWKIYDCYGSVIDTFNISRDGSAPGNAPKLFRLGSVVYLNSGGSDGVAFLDRFSLSINQSIGRLCWQGHIGWVTPCENDTFFLDRDNIYKANSENLEYSHVVAELPEDMRRGDVWIWFGLQTLHVASTASNNIYCYGLDGSLKQALKIPLEWRLSSHQPIVHEQRNVLILQPSDLSEWGSAAILIWDVNDFADESLMQQERLSFHSTAKLEEPGGTHGFRLTVRSDDLEVAVRHAAHHLVRLVHKVAPGLMNRGTKIDDSFNGAIELEIVCQDQTSAPALYEGYLYELFRKMKSSPFCYKAGDSVSELSLTIFWSG